MKRKQKNVKAIVLSLGLVAGMLLPVGVSAQEDAANGGGLLGFGKLFNSKGEGGLFGENPAEEGEIDIYGVGQPEDAPLGSGIAIMLLAGAGYVALKKKED